MKLSQKYRPTTIGDIVGQIPVRHIKSMLANPYSSCWCLLGPPGVGKSETASVLASELDCHDEMSGKFKVVASRFGIDAAEVMFGRHLRLKPFNSTGWRVLIIEELELLSPQCQNYLKVALEELPKQTIVVATSNGTDRLDVALMQRFTTLTYLAGPFFAKQALRKLRDIWEVEVGGPAPDDIAEWGWSGDRFSFRMALHKLQQFVDSRQRTTAAV